MTRRAVPDYRPDRPNERATTTVGNDPTPIARNNQAADAAQDIRNDPPLLLTYEAAGDLLMLHADTVRRLVEEGELDAIHIRRSVRIARVELEAFVRRKQAEHAPVLPWQQKGRGR